MVWYIIKLYCFTTHNYILNIFRTKKLIKTPYQYANKPNYKI